MKKRLEYVLETHQKPDGDAAKDNAWFLGLLQKIQKIMLHFCTQITEHSSPSVLCNPSMPPVFFRTQENQLSAYVLHERQMGLEVFIYRHFGVSVEVCRIPEGKRHK